ncbi:MULTISPECIES: efflux RND transporter periplasmic adaptor subunit [Arenibacter]|jgi:HlyD family secretion protein|uniref:Macrolide export protein MacA n=1 Tax=Arenibacter algicola TaxID=616991 RepID=A0A221UWM9_9FLAO|nr:MULTISPECIES: efflux RND transporter periplasmic adaptor subunit [Arenibacter]ASO05754.1 macrolide export protein MacA [Arenibacter algicola]MDX1758118.1 efflux RND transporter periplasmic adaptor subunit [Arenibacter algicola]GBF20874.1 macrolide export protein MacA [Arenibacter sp. NBRC 103722]HCO86336.1 efflux RND transporter periplasmic adaptor subunit [Arenibacter sp.]|tara:strand:- start:15750 stop:16898 length:1149 start_codon:yes stop_codon:yes gene_type:complete
MNKIVKYVLIGVLVLGALWAAAFFVKSNSKSAITYETKNPFTANIQKKSVATGKVVPEDEVEIKPQISGIIDEIFLKEGAKVNAGDLIAKIKVVPNEQSMNQARGRVKNAEIALNNTKIEYDRNKAIFDKGVISSQDFNTQQLRYDQAKLELQNAQSDYQIIRDGSAGGSATANTNIRATVSGTVLEIPVKEGDQVIQSNNFNDGTTIATIADLSIMIFEGKVDEGEVGKLELGMPLEISLGAINDKKFDAKLRFIAPKGVEESGAVQFKIEGDVTVEDDFLIRAGYSANASLVLEKKDSVMVIPEALLQFDKVTDKPFVEVAIGTVEEQKFERKDVEIGISDGVNVEIVSGITKDDKVKIWNKTEPIKKGTEEDSETEEGK